MRVVIDTNVLVSALLSPAGKAAQILRLEKAGRIELVFSPDTVAEHLRVLSYPKIKKRLAKCGVTMTVAEKYLKNIAKGSVVVMGKTEINAIPADPSDNIYLACAVEGQADYLVSGDHHLKDLQEFQGIRIVDPATFLELLK